MRRICFGLPFLFLLALAWPGTAAQSPGFQALFARYRGTDADRAVREFADWSEGQLAADAHLSQAQDDPWSAAALAQFHLEADLWRLNVQRDLQDRGEGSRSPLRPPMHIFRGQALLEKQVIPAARRDVNRALLEFCRDWYIVRRTAYAGPKGHDFRGASESAERHVGDDPEIQLLYGIDRSIWMGPYAHGDSPYAFGDYDAPDAKGRLVSIRGETYHSGRGREAEIAFRRALTLAPSLVEARLRLGRLYQLLGRRKDAEAELLRAASDAAAGDDRVTAYLAALFLGELYEDAGRLSEAVREYATAIKGYPLGTSARLALGDALFVSGRADEAWATMRSALGGDARLSLRDPWGVYGAIGYWQLGSRLAAMRKQVSQTPLTTLPPPVTRGLELRPEDAGSVLAASPRQRGPQFRSGVEGVRVEVLVANDDRVVPDLRARQETSTRGRRVVVG